jgi:hypothetical protein
MGACFGCLEKGDSDADNEYVETTSPVASVTCKIGLKGPGVTTSLDSASNIYTLAGSGMAIGTCSLDCDTAYWEVVAGTNPAGLKIGIKRHNFKKKDALAAVLDGSQVGDCPSWILGGESLKEGDVIGVHWDQTDLPMLSFTKNGMFLEKESINRVRPAIDCVPAISLADDSSCQVIFDGNSFKQKAMGNKFKMIVCATNLI